jgi:uncharacterized protein YdeI (YjbR/CyaY-like superfamily)
MTTNVNLYFTDGCGRCPLAASPQCKVNAWLQEMKLLRSLLQECNLVEEIKWGVPCYTYNKKNIVVLAAFKNYCALSFFNGALLSNNHNILIKPGPNTQAARIVKFTNSQQIIDSYALLKSYVFEAVEIEKVGLNVTATKVVDTEIVQEFHSKLNESLELKTAFQSLTPGRQRAYLNYFLDAKLHKTRLLRINNCLEKILSKKGLND